MGIKGLRSALRTNQLRQGHIREFAEKTVVIDGSAWLHRGAFSCARELALGKDTSRHIDYCLTLTKMLLHYKVSPIIVLDGISLPAKRKTNEERQRSRAENLALGKQSLEKGDLPSAERFFQKAIQITTLMGRELKRRAWNELHVTCITAPYEADAQMAFLVRCGMAVASITEDSDLIPYGVETVVYKMDRGGSCLILDRDSMRGDGVEAPSLRLATGLTARVHTCILAGCDYLQSIPGIGIRKARDLVHRFGCGHRAIRWLKAAGTHAVPEGYADSFRRAEWCGRPHDCCPTGNGSRLLSHGKRFAYCCPQADTQNLSRVVRPPPAMSGPSETGAPEQVSFALTEVCCRGTKRGLKKLRLEQDLPAPPGFRPRPGAGGAPQPPPAGP